MSDSTAHIAKALASIGQVLHLLREVADAVRVDAMSLTALSLDGPRLKTACSTERLLSAHWRAQMEHFRSECAQLSDRLRKAERRADDAEALVDALRRSSGDAPG